MSAMWEAALAELLALQYKIFRKLNETCGITKELAEAVSRGDGLSVKMLISSRQIPILELQELYSAVKLKSCDLSGEDKEAFDRLIVRQEPPQNAAEQEVANQMAANQRLLEQLVEMDQRVNQGVCQERSVYLKR